MCTVFFGFFVNFATLQLYICVAAISAEQCGVFRAAPGATVVSTLVSIKRGRGKIKTKNNNLGLNHKIEQKTKVYLLDYNVRQILAKYVALHRETAQTKVTRLLWIMYCAYFRYQTGEYNSLGVCRLILKFLQRIRTTSSRLKDYFVQIEKFVHLTTQFYPQIN